MDRIEPITKFDHRDSILHREPLVGSDLKHSFGLALERVKQLYPKFQPANTEFEPNRIRFMDEIDHYEFFLVKKP